MPQAYWSPERKLRAVQGPKTHIFTFGVLMWEAFVSHKPRLRPGSKRHPQLGKFPPRTPRSYALLAAACMAPMACDRPSTVGVVECLCAVKGELTRQLYTDLTGTTQVRNIILIIKSSSSRGSESTAKFAGKEFRDRAVVPCE